MTSSHHVKAVGLLAPQKTVGRPATGWSLADKAYFLIGTTWTLYNGGALEIEVKGFNAVVTPGVTISESTLAVTEGGATDTYTVVLDTAPTGDVTIAVTETSPDISRQRHNAHLRHRKLEQRPDGNRHGRGRLYYRIRGDRHHHALGLGHSRHHRLSHHPDSG